MYVYMYIYRCKFDFAYIDIDRNVYSKWRSILDLFPAQVVSSIASGFIIFSEASTFPAGGKRFRSYKMHGIICTWNIL